jgi:hypothetical protein
MKCFDQVNFAEDGTALHVGGEVHHVGQGVPVQNGDGVESPVVATGSQDPSFLGTMCSREAQGDLLCDTIPAFSEAANSSSAMFRLAGSRQRALANTGLPSVRM